MNNESALNFYRHFGFEVVETKEQYYKRIEPADAHVLEKNVKSSKGSIKTTVSKTVNGSESDGSKRED